MRVLCVNCGSSTLKFDLFDVPKDQVGSNRVASGLFDRIGGEGSIKLSITSGGIKEKQVPAVDYGQAMQEAMSLLEERRLLSDIDAVGHRVVHGGPRFRSPVVIDRDVIDAIEAVSELAPLHNQPALQAIEAARARLGPSLPMVATFDTAFYADLPAVASLYAIPRELSEKHSIRRYGFHGLAHRYMVQHFRELNPQVERPRLITLQLGNGCSATASVDGRPLDTSMGFTPLEGLIMGTRSGDLDPSLPLFLTTLGGLSPQQVKQILNSESGLLGLSGLSNDMRDLLRAEAAGDERAALAVEAFCYRVRKYVGAYMAVLGGAEALVFGGGIGEHSAAVRQRICSGLEWAGVALDTEANRMASIEDRRVSADGRVAAWVVAVDEAAVIAQDAVDCLAQGREAAR